MIVRLGSVVMTDERGRFVELAGVRIEDVRDLRLVAHPQDAREDERAACNRGKHPSRAWGALGQLHASCR